MTELEDPVFHFCCLEDLVNLEDYRCPSLISDNPILIFHLTLGVCSLHVHMLRI